MREHRDRVDRRARRAIEERVRPGLPAELPACDLAERPAEQAEVESGAAGRRRADGELAVDPAGGWAEYLVGRAERLRDDTHERNRRPERVAERRLAARRVPAIEALRCEANPGDAISADHEAERGRRDLDDIAAAVRIEQVRAAEVVRIGLAIVAVADDAVGGIARGVLDVAGDVAAAATKFDGDSHRSSSGSAAVRAIEHPGQPCDAGQLPEGGLLDRGGMAQLRRRVE